MKEFSKGKFVVSIIFALIAALGIYLSISTFSIAYSALHESENAAEVLALGFFGIVMFILAAIATLAFALVGFGFSVNNFANAKNGKTITMFIISLIELLTPIVLVLILFIS